MRPKKATLGALNAVLDRVIVLELELAGLIEHNRDFMGGALVERLIKLQRLHSCSPYVFPAINIDAASTDEITSYAHLAVTDTRLPFEVGEQISSYCLRSIAARAQRAKGDIETAQILEAELEAIYDRLPLFARW